MKQIIVTKHEAIAKYIRASGLAPAETPCYSSVSPAFVKGCHVLGIVPLSIAACAELFTEVKVTLPPSAYDKELTFDQVCAVIKEVRTYKIQLEKDHLT